MQIGLRIGPQNEFTPIPEYLKFVKRAEALGFDPLLFSDTVSLSHFHLRDPFVVMALAAGATERAGIGTGVTVPFIRHPAVVANAFGSIDDAIAPRRTFLGIGSGDTAVYLLGKRAARLAEMREYLSVIRGLLNGEPVTYEGAQMRSNWRKPHVPICLAADGPKMLAIAGELTDAVILGAGATLEVIEWARGCIAEGEGAPAAKPATCRSGSISSSASAKTATRFAGRFGRASATGPIIIFAWATTRCRKSTFRACRPFVRIMTRAM